MVTENPKSKRGLKLPFTFRMPTRKGSSTETSGSQPGKSSEQHPVSTNRAGDPVYNNWLSRRNGR